MKTNLLPFLALLLLTSTYAISQTNNFLIKLPPGKKVKFSFSFSATREQNISIFKDKIDEKNLICWRNIDHRNSQGGWDDFYTIKNETNDYINIYVEGSYKTQRGPGNKWFRSTGRITWNSDQTNGKIGFDDNYDTEGRNINNNRDFDDAVTEFWIQ